jgi:agmatinase
LEQALEKIGEQVQAVMDQGGVPLSIGGEHTVTLPAVKAVRSLHPDLVVVHLDAHTDLREHYEGSPINHATVMRRIAEIVGPDHLIQLGIRSGTKEEFAWMREHGTVLEWLPSAERSFLKRIDNRPVYLTVDLDVLDPSCMPGTGNPEAGGWSYREMERLLHVMNSVHLAAADVVELNPSLDSSEVSTITAAKIVRELLLILARPRREDRLGIGA